MYNRSHALYFEVPTHAIVPKSTRLKVTTSSRLYNPIIVIIFIVIAGNLLLLAPLWIIDGKPMQALAPFSVPAQTHSHKALLRGTFLCSCSSM